MIVHKIYLIRWRFHQRQLVLVGLASKNSKRELGRERSQFRDMDESSVTVVDKCNRSHLRSIAADFFDLTSIPKSILGEDSSADVISFSLKSRMRTSLFEKNIRILTSFLYSSKNRIIISPK